MYLKNHGKNSIKKYFLMEMKPIPDVGDVMELYQGAFFIIAVLAMVMLIMAVKTNSMFVLNFVLRSVAGSLLIFGINLWLESSGFSMSVGLNPVSVLTSGILGFPGVILLFGIKIYSVL